MDFSQLKVAGAWIQKLFLFGIEGGSNFLSFKVQVGGFK